MQAFLRARRLTATLCITGVAVLVSAFSASGASAQSALPVNYDFGAAALATFNAPTVAPPGANNWSCKPTAWSTSVIAALRKLNAPLRVGT